MNTGSTISRHPTSENLERNYECGECERALLSLYLIHTSGWYMNANSVGSSLCTLVIRRFTLRTDPLIAKTRAKPLIIHSSKSLQHQMMHTKEKPLHSSSYGKASLRG